MAFSLPSAFQISNLNKHEIFALLEPMATFPLFGSFHNFMLYIFPKLYRNQSFFVAPVNSRLFPDSGIPNRKTKSYKIGVILERKVLLEQRQSL